MSALKNQYAEREEKLFLFEKIIKDAPSTSQIYNLLNGHFTKIRKEIDNQKDELEKMIKNELIRKADYSWVNSQLNAKPDKVFMIENAEKIRLHDQNKYNENEKKINDLEDSIRELKEQKLDKSFSSSFASIEQYKGIESRLLKLESIFSDHEA